MNQAKRFTIVVIVLITLILGWWLLSPLFIDKTVNEDLPTSSNVDSTEMMDDMKEESEGMQGEESMEEMMDVSGEMMKEESETMQGEESMEEMMDTAGEEMKEESEGMQDKESMEEMMDSAGEEMKKESETMQEKENDKEEMMASNLGGKFELVDDEHIVAGDVMVHEIDGKKIVRFENFESTNGPDLQVYLVSGDKETSEGVSLGKLKGNKGNQNYEIPDDVSLNEGDRIVIWCKAFDVDFGQVILHDVNN